MEERRRVLSAIPQIRLPHREYFLFTARLVDVPTFTIRGFPEEPNIWWPEDHSWYVSKDVERGDSTYVGGSSACVEALLATPELQAQAVQAGDAIEWEE